jgi:hypothetical protein
MIGNYIRQTRQYYCDFQSIPAAFHWKTLEYVNHDSHEACRCKNGPFWDVPGKRSEVSEIPPWRSQRPRDHQRVDHREMIRTDQQRPVVFEASPAVLTPKTSDVFDAVTERAAQGDLNYGYCQGRKQARDLALYHQLSVDTRRQWHYGPKRH